MQDFVLSSSAHLMKIRRLPSAMRNDAPFDTWGGGPDGPIPSPPAGPPGPPGPPRPPGGGPAGCAIAAAATSNSPTPRPIPIFVIVVPLLVHTKVFYPSAIAHVFLNCKKCLLRTQFCHCQIRQPDFRLLTKTCKIHCKKDPGPTMPEGPQSISSAAHDVTIAARVSCRG